MWCYIDQSPEWLTACNCSVCYRLGALWAHGDDTHITLNHEPDATEDYIWGDKMLAYKRCKQCGCTTHWLGLPPEGEGRMAVNFRMCETADIADIRVRHFDGSNTWQYLD